MALIKHLINQLFKGRPRMFYRWIWIVLFVSTGALAQPTPVVDADEIKDSQAAPPPAVSDESKPERRILAEIILGGLNYNGDRGFNVDAEPDATSGIGLTVQRPWTESVYLGYGLRGLVLSEDNNNDPVVFDRVTVNATYLTVPVFLRWDLAGQSTRLFLRGTAQLAYLLDVEMITETATTEVEKDITSKFNRWDIWFSAGLGIEARIVNNIGIFVEYSFLTGLEDAIDDNSIASGRQHVEGPVLMGGATLAF